MSSTQPTKNKSSEWTDEKIALVFFGIPAVLGVILFAVIWNASSSSCKYTAGDYSDKYTCAYYACDCPADGGMYDSSPPYYYCREHFSQEKASHTSCEAGTAETAARR